MYSGATYSDATYSGASDSGASGSDVLIEKLQFSNSEVVAGLSLQYALYDPQSSFELEDAIDLSQRSHRAILHCHSKVEEGSRDVDYWLDLADAQLKIYSQLDLEPYRQRLKEALKEYEESLAATKALAEHYQLTVDRHREERMRASLRQQLQMELDALNEKSLSQ
ncbi:hypothetical protein QAD02_005759 [Eretmocerus hayati]|uniref:Uncharacterized protein n=1 Tax=Eretmocerus hayati TaxID=131215 RepID=A0ACC2NTQ1_9HYME|nr:hypothetical protein QAD02_005759 [Eretmocerus hayati]